MHLAHHQHQEQVPDGPPVVAFHLPSFSSHKASSLLQNPSLAQDPLIKQVSEPFLAKREEKGALVTYQRKYSEIDSSMELQIFQ
jgi:hypothetical protein